MRHVATPPADAGRFDPIPASLGARGEGGLPGQDSAGHSPGLRPQLRPLTARHGAAPLLRVQLEEMPLLPPVQSMLTTASFCENK